MNHIDIKKYLHTPPQTREEYQQAYENYEVEYWCDKFGVTKEKLKQAIAKAGLNVREVENYLRNNGSIA